MKAKIWLGIVLVLVASLTIVSGAWAEEKEGVIPTASSVAERLLGPIGEKAKEEIIRIVDQRLVQVFAEAGDEKGIKMTKEAWDKVEPGDVVAVYANTTMINGCIRWVPQPTPFLVTVLGVAERGEWKFYLGYHPKKPGFCSAVAKLVDLTGERGWLRHCTDYGYLRRGDGQHAAKVWFKERGRKLLDP